MEVWLCLPLFFTNAMFIIPNPSILTVRSEILGLNKKRHINLQVCMLPKKRGGGGKKKERKSVCSTKRITEYSLGIAIPLARSKHLVCRSQALLSFRLFD